MFLFAITNRNNIYSLLDKKIKSSNTSDEVGFKSKVPKTKFDTSHDLASNLSGHEHRRKVASVEKSIAGLEQFRSGIQHPQPQGYKRNSLRLKTTQTQINYQVV